MTTKLGRERKSKQRTGIAIVAGIFVALVGLYFIFGISAQTNKKNAKCTEDCTGIVTDVKASGSKYLATIDYKIDTYEDTVTVETKKELTVGSEVAIKYEPMYYKHLYIDGITPTGTKDVITGVIMVAVGAILSVGGFLLKKFD